MIVPDACAAPATAKRSLRQNGVRRRPVNSKITDELRARLETAAAESGRTLSAEIEARLAASFGEALNVHPDPRVGTLAEQVAKAVVAELAKALRNGHD